jgi:hypothetical protein
MSERPRGLAAHEFTGSEKPPLELRSATALILAGQQSPRLSNANQPWLRKRGGWGPFYRLNLACAAIC